MKFQRSHFRLITILLVLALIGTTVLCAFHIGLLQPVFPPEEGNTSIPEESLNRPENIPESVEKEPSPAEPPTVEYVTTGL